MKEILARLSDSWSNLAPRERILLEAAAGLLATTLVFFLVVTPCLSLAREVHLRAQNARNQIEAMTRLQREYVDLQSRLGSVEQRIKNNSDKRNLRTLLESLAQQSAVKINSMEERQAGKDDHYTETKVEVALKNVTLSQAVKYLQNIESADRQLSVKSLRIKGRQDQSKLLDVTFSVSSFEPY